MQVITENKRAYHLFDIVDKYEVGLRLLGSEVKSIRKGNISLREAYISFQGSDAWLKGAHIAKYPYDSSKDYDPARLRKLLLHQQEINRLEQKSKEKGTAIIPLKIYFKNNLAKLEIGVGRGKKLHDRRREIKERDEKRQIARAIRGK